MEALNNLLVTLTTENNFLTKLIGLPFIFIKSSIIVLLFTTFFNIESNKKQKILYIVLVSFSKIICSFILLKPIYYIINFIINSIFVKFIFKVDFVTALSAELLPLITISVLELIMESIILLFFKFSYTQFCSVPMYEIIISILICITLFVFYKLVKLKNYHINISDILNKNNKKFIILNIIITFIVLFMQAFLLIFFSNKSPFPIVLINIVFLLSYIFISFVNLTKIIKLENTQIALEQEKLSHRTLQIVHDNTRAFKHDFSNILAGIGGYIATDDMEGLKKYYTQLFKDCNRITNYSSLSPDVVNSPPIYAVLANKYYKADKLGIKVKLDSFIDFNNLYMDIYEFTRILGILMDNAIEAASECDKKLINISIKNDFKLNRQLLIIENTYKDKNLDISKISEKGFSSKKNNTGLGLWEVDKIIKRNKNIAKFTSKNSEFFIQQIEMYKQN